MFKVNYRIVDDIDELKSMTVDFFDTEYGHVSGFIEVCFGEQKEGCYYHENPIQEGEVGGEYIDYWLNDILDVANTLPLTKYAAFYELDTINKWMEFKINGDKIIINVAVDEEMKTNNLFIKEPYKGFKYIEPLDFCVNMESFDSEIRNTIKRFLEELNEINPQLLKTKMSMELSSKLKI